MPAPILVNPSKPGQVDYLKCLHQTYGLQFVPAFTIHRFSYKGRIVSAYLTQPLLPYSKPHGDSKKQYWLVLSCQHLGRGGYGIVYRCLAKITFNGQQVNQIKPTRHETALKYSILSIEQRPKIETIFSSEAAILREQAPYMRVKTPASKFFIGKETHLAIKMRYLKGQSLRDLIIERNMGFLILTASELLEIGLAIFNSYEQYFLNQKLVHTDIKDGNLLLDWLDKINVHIIDLAGVRSLGSSASNLITTHHYKDVRLHNNRLEKLDEYCDLASIFYTILQLWGEGRLASTRNKKMVVLLKGSYRLNSNFPALPGLTTHHQTQLNQLCQAAVKVAIEDRPGFQQSKDTIAAIAEAHHKELSERLSVLVNQPVRSFTETDWIDIISSGNLAKMNPRIHFRLEAMLQEKLTYLSPPTIGNLQQCGFRFKQPESIVAKLCLCSAPLRVLDNYVLLGGRFLAKHDRLLLDANIAGMPGDNQDKSALIDWIERIRLVERHLIESERNFDAPIMQNRGDQSSYSQAYNRLRHHPEHKQWPAATLATAIIKHMDMIERLKSLKTVLWQFLLLNDCHSHSFAVDLCLYLDNKIDLFKRALIPDISRIQTMITHVIHLLEQPDILNQVKASDMTANNGRVWKQVLKDALKNNQQPNI